MEVKLVVPSYQIALVATQGVIALNQVHKLQQENVMLVSCATDQQPHLDPQME